jgi:hypothetical protein
MVRATTRLARDAAVDSALGTAPRPVSTTSDRSTGRLIAALASSATSTGSRDTGHTNCPTSSPRRPSRAAR